MREGARRRHTYDQQKTRYSVVKPRAGAGGEQSSRAARSRE